MEDTGRPSFQGGGGERRLEIVSGRGYNHNTGHQMYPTSRPSWSSDSPPVLPASTRPNQVAAAAASSKPWCCGGDSDMKRRKRIARYKAYGVEGRVKASIRNGFRWIKNKCSEIIHGY